MAAWPDGREFTKMDILKNYSFFLRESPVGEMHCVVAV